MGSPHRSSVLLWGSRLCIALVASALVQAGLIALAAAMGDASPQPIGATQHGRFVFGDGEQLWRIDVSNSPLATHLWARPANGWRDVELDLTHHGYVLIEREQWQASRSPFDLPALAIPDWQQFADAAPLAGFMAPPGRRNTVTEVAVGWPWRAVQSRAHHVMTPGMVQVQTPIDQWAIPVLGGIPTRLIPTGLALNLAVFAGAALLGCVLAAHGRTVWRRRRHRCARCNYDRSATSADAPCPECGDHPGTPRRTISPCPPTSTRSSMATATAPASASRSSSR